MITTLITFLIVVLVVAVIFFVAVRFVQGNPPSPIELIGLILGLALLLFAFKLFGLAV
jgi:hypothetical protein